jgi:folate-binding protein YgfZ
MQTIVVRGDDARDFLQGQLSNDLGRLDDEAQIRAAWCTPKGRVIALFDVSPVESGYALTLPAELAENVVQRLAVFRFRAKVEFGIAAQTSSRPLLETIIAGIPHIGAHQSEKYTPHMLNLDLLDALSFDKGCYTGQEIVARIHYKGASKRRTHRFNCEQSVNVGDKISDGTRDVGDVLNASGQTLLAVIPTAKANASLTISGMPLEKQPLPYWPSK